MRARITIAFVSILAIALVLSGGVSLLLVRHAASLNAQSTVLREARVVKAAVKNTRTVPLFENSDFFGVVKSLLGAETTTVVIENGRLLPAPRPGTIENAIDPAKLTKGDDSSGVVNHVAFAAVPVVTVKLPRIVHGKRTTTVSILAIVLESPENFSADSVWFFLFASGLSLLGAAALAYLTTTRVSARVGAVADASQRIAAGDLTARVAVADRTYPELARLDQALNTMAENLERSRDAERAFLLSISHDLRTPLTSIRGYSEAIADGAVSDLPHAAGIVVSEAGRLERLIGDLLDLARLRTRQFSFDLVPVDLGDVVRTGAQAFRYEFDSAGVELEMAIGDAPIEIIGDPHRIGQILANLIENALKFAARRVVVGLEVEEQTVLLTVSDDGPGITPEDLPHVFERLYTNARDVARSVGTGLGLAIVTELAPAMGAAVSVDSPLSDAGGTRFSVRLPIRRLARSTLS